MFNNRNILPNTQHTSIGFGIINDYDGITIKYIDPLTDVDTPLYIPTSTITNPKEIQVIGVRDKAQAYYLGWRAWNRLKYQNTSIEFQATQESDLITISDRILVSQLNRPETQDGEILKQDGLIVTLSNEVSVTNGDTIFLQYYDGTVGNILINSQIDSTTIVLQSAPTLPLVTDINNYARTGFIISNASSSSINLPYLLIDKTPAGKFTNTIKAINYSNNYYANDHVNPTTI
jgi:hypothetical protein